MNDFPSMHVHFSPQCATCCGCAGLDQLFIHHHTLDEQKSRKTEYDVNYFDTTEPIFQLHVFSPILSIHVMSHIFHIRYIRDWFVTHCIEIESTFMHQLPIHHQKSLLFLWLPFVIILVVHTCRCQIHLPNQINELIFITRNTRVIIYHSNDNNSNNVVSNSNKWKCYPIPFI